MSTNRKEVLQGSPLAIPASCLCLATREVFLGAVRGVNNQLFVPLHNYGRHVVQVSVRIELLSPQMLQGSVQNLLLPIAWVLECVLCVCQVQAFDSPLCCSAPSIISSPLHMPPTPNAIISNQSRPGGSIHWPSAHTQSLTHTHFSLRNRGTPLNDAFLSTRVCVCVWRMSLSAVKSPCRLQLWDNKAQQHSGCRSSRLTKARDNGTEERLITLKWDYICRNTQA